MDIKPAGWAALIRKRFDPSQERDEENEERFWLGGAEHRRGVGAMRPGAPVS